MKKIWLLLSLLFAFPAFADPAQDPGQTAATVQPYPLHYVPDKLSPWASLGVGPNNLKGQYLPASYGNLAIGYGDLNGTMTTAAVNNLAIGYNACPKVTAGSQDFCFGTNAGAGITTGVANMLFGTGAGAALTTGSYNIIFDNNAPGTSSCAGCTLNLLIGSGTSANQGNDMTVIGYNAGLHDTGGGSRHTIVGANVGLNNAGNGGAETNILLVGANLATGVILDTATTTSSNVLGIGSGTPGAFDTSVGWGALATNAQDSAFQSAFGYNSLNLSNVAAAENSAFGYASCAAVTSGKNNVCLGYSAGAATLATGSGNILIGSGVDAVASSTSNEINIGGLLFYNNNSTAAPAISSCGTGSPSIDSKANNKSGTVTAGTVATTCTITFAGTGYSTWNHCRVTTQGALSAGYTYTKTAIVVTASTLGGALIDYDCDGV